MITHKWTLHCPPVSILWYVTFLYNGAKSTKGTSLCSIWLYGYLNSFLLESSVAVSLIGLNRNNMKPCILESVQRSLFHASTTLQSWSRERDRDSSDRIGSAILLNFRVLLDKSPWSLCITGVIMFCNNPNKSDTSNTQNFTWRSCSVMCAIKGQRFCLTS